MSYITQKLIQAKSLVGKRIELPVHYDMWARGARYGVVTSVGRDGNCVFVKLDRASAKRRFKVWRIDFDYIKVIGD